MSKKTVLPQFTRLLCSLISRQAQSKNPKSARTRCFAGPQWLVRIPTEAQVLDYSMYPSDAMMKGRYLEHLS